MNGIALAVPVSQTPKLVGVKVEKAGPFRDIWSIAVEIAGGRMNWTEFALGAAKLAVIFSSKTFKGLPGTLLAVAGATAIVQVFDLETRGSRLSARPPFLSDCLRFPYRGSASRTWRR
jgi:MFS superfamily sulfate permease-like transporter